MNKKEQLINLARAKFEMDTNTELLLLAQYIIWDIHKMDSPCLESTPIILKDLESVKTFLDSYDNNLIRKIFEIDYDGKHEDIFDIFKRNLAKYDIKIEDECIQGIYWQNSTDKQILE